MEDNWLNPMNLLKKILISTEILKNQKKYLKKLIKERSSEFQDLGKTIYPDYLIYKYKTEERSLRFQKLSESDKVI